MIGRIKKKVQETYRVAEDKWMLSKLKNTSIYNIEDLSYNVHNLYSKELSGSNDFYGHADAIKRYCGFDSSYQIKASVEHGFFWGDKKFWNLEIEHNLPGIITQGTIRPEILAPYTDKTVYVVGTYIHYAKPYYSDEKLQEQKKRAGKTLLVFPMHSTHGIDVNYNVEQFISEIQKVGKNFDTVRVCVYWKDIIRGIYHKYEEKGYEIVTAGHIYDVNFLSRLRTIIELSDCVMSNDVGSYVGQAVCLRRPVYLWKQEYRTEGTKDTEYDSRTQDERYLGLFNCFGQLRSDISEKQIDLCDRYWGVKSTLSKEALREVLQTLELSYQKDGGRGENIG